MTQLFHPKWLLIIPAFLIAIFIILSVIFSIFKLKFKREETAIISSTMGAAILSVTLSIVNLCTLCLAPTFALFGIFFEFPVPIIAFLFGVSAISLSNIIFEKWQKDFPFKEFIVTTLMITIFLSIMFLAYLIPDFVRGVNAEHPIYFSPENENIHIHADLIVFDGDNKINLYTEENMEKNSFYHFHEGKDQENVMHFEGKKGTLANFLETIDTSQLDECIKRQYEKRETLYSFYVNGKPSELDFGEYVVNVLDKLLLKCGGRPTQEQINSVGDFACIQSKKC